MTLANKNRLFAIERGIVHRRTAKKSFRFPRIRWIAPVQNLVGKRWGRRRRKRRALAIPTGVFRRLRRRSLRWASAPPVPGRGFRGIVRVPRAHRYDSHQGPVERKRLGVPETRAFPPRMAQSPKIEEGTCRALSGRTMFLTTQAYPATGYPVPTIFSIIRCPVHEGPTQYATPVGYSTGVASIMNSTDA